MNPLFFLLGFLGTTGTFLLGRSSNESTRTTEPDTGGSDQPTQVPDTGGSDQPAQVPDTGGSDQPAQVPDTGGSDQPTQVPDTGGSDQPAQVPDTGGSDQPTQVPDTGGSDQPTTIPTAPEQSGENGSGASVEPTVIDGTVDVIAGRVATLDSAEDVTDIQIVSGVQHGNVTVNPDGTFALVLTQSDFTGHQSFAYEATHSDGTTSVHQVNLNVTPGLQDAGWGTGEQHYMLATDANDKVIVETGENHTKVYVSGSNDALSLQDIANAEGMSVGQVTGSWLAQSGYGQTADTALDAEAGLRLWTTVTPAHSQTSNHLLLERGYEYDFEDRLLLRGADGEGEMEPLYIGAWGNGTQPEITSPIHQYQESTSNLVFQDVHLSGSVTLTGAENILFDSVSFSRDEFAVMNSESITIRNSDFLDVIREESKDGGDWEAHTDRIQALFAQSVDGILLEGNLFDHSAWEEGYTWDGDGSAGQAPSMFSHNIYFGHLNTDVTMRDTITMRAASVGAQIRGGGYLEDNVFLDNNAGFNFHGGGDDRVGNYTLFTDNLVTSGAHKDADLIGSYASGGATDGELSSLVDNIITHLMDPNNPAEAEYKLQTGVSYQPWHNHYYDDTIVWNWDGSIGASHPSRITEANVDGLDPDVLNQTTIQLFAEQLLGKPNATIDDLAEFLRAAAADGLENDTIDADAIIRYFQEGFGIESDIRTEATTLRFVPNDLSEGVRWDNRLNWDTEDLPGLFATDSVDLGGNEVVFGTNATIDTLDLNDGTLDVYGGRLTANGGLEGDGTLDITGSGQVWVDGSDGGAVDISIDGGRFVNTGDMSGANVSASGGETILATGGAEFDLTESKTISVFEEAAKVGFDGEDGSIAILDLHEGSNVAFAADDGGLGTIEEFRSGAFGDAPDVQSGIHLGNSDLSIDLSGLDSDAGSIFTLMDADELVGLFGDTNITGLGGRNANIVVDYANDNVTLELSSGNGLVSIETVGQEDDVSSGETALWNALVDGHGVVSETQSAMVDEEELLEAV